MKKLMGLVLCGVMGFTGMVGAQVVGNQAATACADDVDMALSSLSAKQKEALRKVTNKYAMIAGKENGLKQEVLEQFKKEVANICVADDETNGEIQDGKKSNKVMWYIIGGAALLVGGFIVYKLFFSKSPEDKMLDFMKEALRKLDQVDKGEMNPEDFTSWIMKQQSSLQDIAKKTDPAKIRTPTSEDLAIVSEFQMRMGQFGARMMGSRGGLGTMGHGAPSFSPTSGPLASGPLGESGSYAPAPHRLGMMSSSSSTRPPMDLSPTFPRIPPMSSLSGFPSHAAPTFVSGGGEDLGGGDDLLGPVGLTTGYHSSLPDVVTQ